MANLVVRLVMGQEPRNVTRAHATGEVIATEKPKGGIRPLIMSSIFRRIGCGAIAKSTQLEAMAASGPHQLGVGAKDGCVKAFHATTVLAEIRPTKAVMSCDVGAAHQSLNRGFMMQEVRALCPILVRPLSVWYPQDEPTIHWWKVGPGDVREVVSEEGLDQGCPLASPAFGISTCRPVARALEAILREDPTASLLQFADDTHVHTEPANLSRAHQAISDEWAKAGLSLNIAKTEIWTPRADTELGDWERRRVPSLRCLGAFLEDDGIAWSGPGLGGETSEELERAAAKLEAYADRLCELQEAGLTMQLSQALLRYASVGGPQHVLMCKAVSRDQAEAYDARVRICWEKVVGIAFTDSAWSRATLPLKMGG